MCELGDSVTFHYSGMQREGRIVRKVHSRLSIEFVVCASTDSTISARILVITRDESEVAKTQPLRPAQEVMLAALRAMADACEKENAKR